MRPDIILERDGRKTLEIIEVACTFEDKDLSNLDKKYKEKLEKYEPFVQHLTNSHTYETINLKVVVIGVRGYVPGRFFGDIESLLPDDPHRSAVVRRLAVDCAYASAKGSLRLVQGFHDEHWCPPTIPLPARRFTQGTSAPARRFPTSVPTSTSSTPVFDPLEPDDGQSLSSIGVGASR
jgi:hypothetical protein